MKEKKSTLSQRAVVEAYECKFHRNWNFMKPAGRRCVSYGQGNWCAEIFFRVQYHFEETDATKSPDHIWLIVYQTLHKKCVVRPAYFSYVTNTTCAYFSIAQTLRFRAKINAPQYSGFTLGLLGSSCLSARPSVHTKRAISRYTVYSIPTYLLLAHPVCINAAPTGRFPWNLILKSLTKICRQTPNLVKIWKKKPSLRENLNKHYWCRRHKSAIKALLCSTKYFYTVDRDM